MKGKVLITFDDGTADQYGAATLMYSLGLKGTFGVVPSLVDKPGYLSWNDLEWMVGSNHTIANHSYRHGRLGDDPERAHLGSLTPEQITEDALKGKKILEERGICGDYYMAPFGTQNVDGQEHLDILKEHFKWIRLTIGGPVQDGKTWTTSGNKRLYPINYQNPVMGITVAADVRFPSEVRDKVAEACKIPALCVVAYHQSNHVVGNTQNLNWEQFVADMNFISEKVKAGELECVGPEDVN